MASERTQKVTRFNSNSGSGYPSEKGGSVLVKAKQSYTYHGGTKDPLYHALAGKPPALPDDMAEWIKRRAVKPSGTKYDPMGNFGNVRSRQAKVPATGMGVHNSRPGGNAVGSNSNRKGSNPLGRAMNRVGTNAGGKPSGRKGQNPLGSPSNKAGMKSGYSRFSPRGGGKNV